MTFQGHFLAIKELNTTLVTSALPTAPKFNLTDPTSYQSHRWSHTQNTRSGPAPSAQMLHNQE